METFQILSDQFSHFQHLFHRWLAIFCIISSYIFDLSSSPHTWGIRRPGATWAGVMRFIPTHVGHTLAALRSAVTNSVHPHTRGAYIAGGGDAGRVSGSSPHTWGIPAQVPYNGTSFRFIPTHVGHTRPLRATRLFPSVHPHTRGAYACACSPAAASGGSSPHTWGILPVPGWRPGCRRFIPTHVGHTRCRKTSPAPSAVHPHTRGAYPDNMRHEY